MSVIVLKRKFEAIPAPTDIMHLLFGQDTGDREAAKDALQAFLKPVGDLLDLIYLANQMKATAERHVELLHEQEDLASEITQNKGALAGIKTNFAKEQEVQAEKAKTLAAEIQKLQKAKSSLEDEQATRDRLNKAVVAEVAETRKGLLAAVERDIAKAKETLAGVNSSIEAAKVELAALVEKKRAFIASLK